MGDPGLPGPQRRRPRGRPRGAARGRGARGPLRHRRRPRRRTSAPGTTPVFDLDSLRLTALARSLGLTVSVAESPTVEPVDRRPRRRRGQGPGRRVVVLREPRGHRRRGRPPSSPAAEPRARRCATSCASPCSPTPPGPTGWPPCPVSTSIPPRSTPWPTAPDPRAAGIAHAVAAARAVLEVDGVDGVDLSGPGSSQGPAERAAVMREVAEQLRVVTAGAPVTGDRERR